MMQICVWWQQEAEISAMGNSSMEKSEKGTHMLVQDGLSVEVLNQLPQASARCTYGPSLMMLPSVCLSIRILPSSLMDAVSISLMMLCCAPTASTCLLHATYLLIYLFMAIHSKSL